jgi:hypothetical protein
MHVVRHNSRGVDMPHRVCRRLNMKTEATKAGRLYQRELSRQQAAFFSSNAHHPYGHTRPSRRPVLLRPTTPLGLPVSWRLLADAVWARSASPDRHRPVPRLGWPSGTWAIVGLGPGRIRGPHPRGCRSCLAFSPRCSGPTPGRPRRLILVAIRGRSTRFGPHRAPSNSPFPCPTVGRSARSPPRPGA